MDRENYTFSNNNKKLCMASPGTCLITHPFHFPAALNYISSQDQSVLFPATYLCSNCSQSLESPHLPAASFVLWTSPQGPAHTAVFCP